MAVVSSEEIGQALDALLARVRAGETLVITQEDLPVAEMRPVETATHLNRPFGLCAGEFEVPDDFDDPLPEELLRDFEGR